ncbi:MAG: hypothetical protein OXB95_03230, partial [Rhodobacteraceae bacterium]|nr:hypothetical protein [Paracoccaceae bacterium]
GMVASFRRLPSPLAVGIDRVVKMLLFTVGRQLAGWMFFVPTASPFRLRQLKPAVNCSSLSL